jgi:hypothetical protein
MTAALNIRRIPGKTTGFCRTEDLTKAESTDKPSHCF